MKDANQISFDQFFVHRKMAARKRGKPGRKPAPRARVLHRRRGALPKGHPVHVTVRVRGDVPSLRNRRLVAELQASLAKACERGTFRVAHYAIMPDHVHLIVEADDACALASGMKSIGARLARAVNRVFSRRGPVLDGRFHSVLLGTPRQVWNALRYVLLNGRKHSKQAGGDPGKSSAPDIASSGRWFAGWKESFAIGANATREVARAKTWLLSVGWRKHGLISLSEIPGPAG